MRVGAKVKLSDSASSWRQEIKLEYISVVLPLNKIIKSIILMKNKVLKILPFKNE